jgi:hypothetical protein
VSHEAPVQLSFPDEPEVGRVSGVVTISGRRLSVSGERSGLYFRRQYVPFRGPRFLQGLLTPLVSVIGMLFSKRDIAWTGLDTVNPCLRITPTVPPDFWLEVHFQDRQDAIKAASLLEQFWL